MEDVPDGDQFKAALEAARKLVLSSWDALHEPPPTVLYHYTSADGLIGILGGVTPTIHATHAAFLNDPKELLYAEELILKQMRLRRSAFPEGDLTGMFYDALISRLPSLRQTREMYVCSFSEDGDLLSQWMSYTQKGRGYSVAISGAALKTLYPHAPDAVLLRRVFYREDEQMYHLNRLFDAIERMLGDLSPELQTQGEKLTVIVARIVNEMLDELLVALKHPAFAAEKEWRLCVMRRLTAERSAQLPLVQFRAAMGRIIPFIPVPLNDGEALSSRLAAVVLGPALDTSIDKATLVEFLRSRDLPGVVRESVIRLR